MRDEKKTKPQLIDELSEMRRKVDSLESAGVYRKQAEELSRGSKSKYQLLVDNLAQPLTVYDSDGLIIYLNGTAAGNFGIEREQAIGKYLHDFFPLDFADTYVA
ncbi:MAG: PAS domain-containing protein, partial [Chloroflexi bacterium]|nr:PAS domain-containing protein [Chloroflexota bacterium]